MRYYGLQAIECAEANGLLLHKFADPIEGERCGLTPYEAREIAAEDPSLIWVGDEDDEYAEAVRMLDEQSDFDFVEFASARQDETNWRDRVLRAAQTLPENGKCVRTSEGFAVDTGMGVMAVFSDEGEWDSGFLPGQKL